VDGKDTDKEEHAGKPGFTLDNRDGLSKCIMTGFFEPFGKTRIFRMLKWKNV